MEAFFADLRGLRSRLASEIDANETSFRFRAVLERPDGGVVVEVHDVGEIELRRDLIEPNIDASPLRFDFFRA